MHIEAGAAPPTRRRAGGGNKRRPAPLFLLARQQIPRSSERPSFVPTQELNLPFSVLESSLMVQGMAPCLSDAAE